MTVLQITPGLPPVWGPYKAKPGSRYFTAAGVTPAQAPYLDRLGICLHLVNYSNIGGTAASFHVNHFVPQGDKVSGSGSLYGTCYHGVIGGAGDVVISLDETAGPNSAGTASNARFVHLVMMMGDWTHPDERHERTIEAVAQLCADMCIGFGIPPTWCNVYNERDQTKRLAAAMTLTNPDRHKVGIFGHRDITAAYTTLTRAGLTERAAPFKNTHGDPGNFPPDRLITRVRQIIEERTDDMDRLCSIREIPADWPTHPCLTHPGFYVDHGGILEPVTTDQAAVRARQKSIKGDPTVADSVAAIDRNTLGSYRLQPGTRPHAPIAISEFLPAV